jgi:hypothetical protein
MRIISRHAIFALTFLFFTEIYARLRMAGARCYAYVRAPDRLIPLIRAIKLTARPLWCQRAQDEKAAASKEVRSKAHTHTHPPRV